MEVPAGSMLRAEISGAVEAETRLARGPEIRRSAERPRHVPGQHVQRLARCVAGREAFCIRDECRQALVPAVRQLAPQHAVPVFGELWIISLVRLERGPPGVMERLPARADAGLEMLAHPLGDEEF